MQRQQRDTQLQASWEDSIKYGELCLQLHIHHRENCYINTAVTALKPSSCEDFPCYSTKSLKRVRQKESLAG